MFSRRDSRGNRRGLGGGGASPPAVPALTAPANSSLHWHNKIVVVSATTPDSNLDEMRWVLDPGPSEVVVATDASSPYSTTWTVGTGIAPGAHTLVARAVRGRQTTDSAPISITIEQGVVQPASCKLWLEANDLATGTLATWADRSGNGNDTAAIASPTVDTSWVGARKRVVLNGTTQYLSAPVAVGTGTAPPLTVILVCKQLTDAGVTVFWDQSSNSSNIPLLNLTDEAGAGGAYGSYARGDSNDLKTNTFGSTNTTEHVLVAAGAATGSVWRDGTLLTSSLNWNSTTRTLHKMTIGAIKRGADAAAFFQNLAVVAVAAWNITLSTADRQTEEARLKAKWGTP